MRVWSLISQKGGSGKTTLALHLSIAALSDNLQVAVIDLDPQGSAEQWSRLREKKKQEPAIERGSAQQLDDMLDAARKYRAGLVVIDTPPAVERSMTYAASAADVVIVPTRTGILDQNALRETLDYLKRMAAISKAIVVINAPSKDKDGLAAVKSIAAAFGVSIAATELKDDVKFTTSLSDGLGITEMRKNPTRTQIECLFNNLREFENKRTKARGRAVA